MTTMDTIQRYFESLQQKNGWQSLLADNVAFTSYTSPVKLVNGRDAYLKATERFYSMISTVELCDLMVDGERACARTRYRLQPPNGGPAFGSDVAEIFSVRDGKIDSLSIYFDSAPFAK